MGREQSLGQLGEQCTRRRGRCVSDDQVAGSPYRQDDGGGVRKTGVHLRIVFSDCADTVERTAGKDVWAIGVNRLHRGVLPVWQVPGKQTLPDRSSGSVPFEV